MSLAEMRGTVVRTMRANSSQLLTNHLHNKKLDRQMAA